MYIFQMCRGTEAKIIFFQHLSMGRIVPYFARRERSRVTARRSPLPRSAYIHVVADDEEAATSSRRGQKARRLSSWRTMPSYFEGRASSTPTRSCRPFSTTEFSPLESRVASSRERRWPARDAERTADRRRQKKRPTV